jgi:hypothetical protein
MQVVRGSIRLLAVVAVATFTLSTATQALGAEAASDASALAVGPSDAEAQYHRYIVVGAGPGGLQIAHYLASAGRDYVVLEAGGSPGSFFRTFPRWRQLISINKRATGRQELDFNLRHDWNSLLSEASHAAPGSYSVLDGAVGQWVAGKGHGVGWGGGLLCIVAPAPGRAQGPRVPRGHWHPSLPPLFRASQRPTTPA